MGDFKNNPFAKKYKEKMEHKHSKSKALHKKMGKKLKVDGVSHKTGFSVTKGSEGVKDKDGSFHYTRKVLRGSHY